MYFGLKKRNYVPNSLNFNRIVSSLFRFISKYVWKINVNRIIRKGEKILTGLCFLTFEYWYF